jgi:hypothetical protein
MSMCLGTYRFDPRNLGRLASYIEEQESRAAMGGVAKKHSPMQESVWATLDFEGDCILRENFVVVDFPNHWLPKFRLIRWGRRSSLILMQASGRIYPADVPLLYVQTGRKSPLQISTMCGAGLFLVPVMD